MPKLNIIYDSRRHEKYEPLISELERQGISDYEIWPCLLLPDIVQSINASHKMIVNYAQDNGWDEVFIAEDDLYFPADDGWDYFLKKKPDYKEYDLYLGCTYIPETPPKQVCGFHLYSVSSRFYEKFLSVPDFCHIDTEMNNTGGEFVFCYPFPAMQRSGFSANNKTKVNYNSVFDARPNDVYR